MDTTTNPTITDIRWVYGVGHPFAIIGDYTLTQTDTAYDVYAQLDGDEVRIAKDVTLDAALGIIVKEQAA
jgi:hypothetical protein